jgi:hypothetical protein
MAVDLIRSGYLARKNSIDILDDLDFDFLDGIKNDLEGSGDAYGEDTFGFDFGTEAGHVPVSGSTSAAAGSRSAQTHASNGGNGTHAREAKPRTGSIDMFQFFENTPYDAANENSLMDELHYLNRQYGDDPSNELLGTYNGAAGTGQGGKPVSPRNRVAAELARAATAGANKGDSATGSHVSFNRYVTGLEGDSSNLTGHKGRRDSWDIAAQYIQQEEELGRGNGSVGGAGRGTTGGMWAQQAQRGGSGLTGASGLQGAGQAGGGAKSGGGARKVGPHWYSAVDVSRARTWRSDCSSRADPF